MEKVRRKITVLRVLQVVFYALGFPLFVHLVMLTNKPVAESYLASGINGYMAIIIAAVIWVVVALIQLLFRGICKKNRLARAVWVALFATVLTLAPIVYSDFMLKGQYEEMVAKYVEETNLEEGHFYTYEKIITPANYEGELTKINKEIESYAKTFNLNINVLEGKNYGANGDGSEVTFNEEDQAYYSPNGMFSDGYLFSLKQAIAVQRAYYENKLAYAAEGKDIEAELVAALLALENDSNSDWNKYKKGASASSFEMEGFEYITSADEYELAYGEDGYAKKFYVTDDRLDAIASVIGGKLGANKEVGALLSILGMIVELPEGLDIKALLTEDLTVDDLIDVINGLGLGKTLADLIGTGNDSLTKDDLMGLLEGYSNYQSPSTYPIFYFLEDEALKEYAYANYYATIHGAKVGCVLVGDNVGLMNLDNMAGTPNPYSEQGLIDMFDRWDAQTELIETFYPMVVVRTIALKMSAAIVFCILAAYWFTAKIDEQYAKLKLAKK